MAISYGDLVDHISRVFGAAPSNRFSLWQRIQDVEFQALQLLEEAGKPSSDRFNIPFRDLPRDIREDLISERSALLDVESLFGRIDEGGSSGFVVRRPPTTTETGYGTFTLPRSAFVGASQEEIANRLAFISQTVQIDDTIAEGAARYRLSGSTPSVAFIQDTASQAFNIQNVRNATRLVFDVETAGLEADSGIWQLSARLMRGDSPVLDAQGQEKSVNLLFRNNRMNFGAYGEDAGRLIPFEEFYESLRGGKPLPWIESGDFSKGLMQFFDLSQEADYLVGQNTAFDVRMMIHGIKGQIKSSPEFEEAAQAFMRQIDQGRVVDTRMLSMMTFGSDNVLEIAEELKKYDKFTPQSMENILLQSSFLEDLASDLNKQGLDGWKEITARIKTGMHHGDVDTWFEDHLFRMQTDVLSGTRSGILRNVALSNENLREAISEAAAITPLTKVKELGGITPIEYLVQHQRTWDSPAVTEITDAQLRQGGLYSRWIDQHLTKEGVFSRASTLVDAGFEPIQSRAMAANLPFAGLSSFERMISTAIGRHGSPALPDHVARLRDVMGDLAGSAVVQTPEKAAIHGGRNVALPLGLIQEAEEAGALSSRFTGALADNVEELQTARWSVINWDVDRKDIALVADIFQNEKDVARFTSYLEGLSPDDLKRYGITPDSLLDYTGTLTRYGEKYGVQIGIVGEQSGTREIVDLLVQAGHDVDSKGPQLRVGVFGVEGLDNAIATTPSMLDTGDFAQRTGDILDHTRSNQALFNRMMDPELNPNIARSIWAGGGEPERVNRIYSALETHLPKMRGRLGIAALGLAGYYLFQKKREQSTYDATIAQQDFESHDFYENYKAQIGEQVPVNYRTRSTRDNTAGMVQYLDRNKTRSHQMGADKHSHLFVGG